MKRVLGRVGLCVALAVLGGCVSSLFPPAVSLPKGEQLAPLAVLDENSGKVACVNYDTGTDSCESLVRWRKVGNEIVARESALFPQRRGQAQRVELLSTNSIEGQGLCVDAEDISIVYSELNASEAEFVIGFTRFLLSSFGGACATYFRGTGAGEYVVSTTGGNGQPMPPGDTRLRFFDGEKRLRVTQPAGPGAG